MNVFDDKVFGNGSNYVYYQRLAEDTHFRSAPRIYMRGITKAGQYRDIINNINLNIVGALRSQAAAEREKEINVMRRIAPNINYNNMSIIELINQMNQLIGLRDQYQQYLKYLRDIYPTSNHKNAKNMSPVVSSYISTRLISLINSRYITDFENALLAAVTKNANSTEIKRIAGQFAQKVTDDLLSNVDNITSDLLYDLGKTNYTLGDEYLIWKDFFDKVNSDLNLRNKFITDIMRRFGLQEKTAKAIKMVRDKEVKTSKKAIRTVIEATAAPQGGYIYEVIAEMMQGFAIGSSISTSRLSDKGTTDLLTASVDFQYENLVKEKLVELESGTGDKAQAVQKLTEFTEFLKNNVGDGFIIYGNAKSYRLDRLSDLTGYFDGGTRNIQQLPSVMASYNIPISQDTVELVINTIPGAILEGDTTVQEFLTEALAGQVAKLLFDDWTTIGDSSGSFDAIHVFNLSGVTVPLSYLLEKLADAAEEAAGDLLNHPNAYIQVQFNLPSDIKFREPSQTTHFIQDQIRIERQTGKKRGRGNGGLQLAWDAQRDEALASTFGINFLSNFNTLLSQLTSQLGI